MEVETNLIPLVPTELSAEDRAVIYARFSTKNQDPRSIDDQVRNCQRYATEEKLTNILVLSDEGLSGSSDDRPGLQQLLALVKKRPLMFRHVIIDDSSRLSRDSIDSQAIVFLSLRSAGVIVHDVANRIRSDDEHAEMFWGMRGIIDSMYVRDVRKKVIRGMEGRALAGFSTGGRCYGYTSIPEEHPQQPQHPRRKLVVLPDEAAVVLRAFKMFLEGQGSQTIADTFNREHIAPPRGAHWRSTGVEKLLNNERYIGHIVWRKSEWQKDPLTKKYKTRPRPRSEWLVREDPSLRIIPQNMWDAVRALRAARGRFKPGRPLGAKNAIRPLTGLLYCGVCGGPLYVVGGKRKNGKPYSDYGCGVRRRGGPALCSNGRMMSEKKVVAVVLAHTSKYLSTNKFDEWVELGRQRHAETIQRENRENREAVTLAEAIHLQEARIDRVLEMVASGASSSDSLKRKLVREEGKLTTLRHKMSKLLTPREHQVTAVDADVLRKQMERLPEIFAARPGEARDAIRKFVRRVTMFPTEKGVKFRISLQPSLILPLAENSAAVLDMDEG